MIHVIEEFPLENDLVELEVVLQAGSGNNLEAVWQTCRVFDHHTGEVTKVLPNCLQKPKPCATCQKIQDALQAYFDRRFILAADLLERVRQNNPLTEAQERLK